jgi:hypothetical protein
MKYNVKATRETNLKHRMVLLLLMLMLDKRLKNSGSHRGHSRAI